MELRDALSQIAEIRQQMARSTLFRGYRAAPALISALVAVVASAAQPLLAPQPDQHIRPYLVLWFSAALISMIAFAVEMTARYRRSGALHRQITLHAIEQFVPCLVAGATVTFVIVKMTPDVSWMLPGLWQVLFSLGVFASRRLLPHATFFVAAFYLLSGLAALGAARGEHAFSPWTMGIGFGVGQTLVAAVLYWNFERRAAIGGRTEVDGYGPH
jgi:hypothetical protein